MSHYGNEHSDPTFLLHFYHLLDMLQQYASFYWKSITSSNRLGNHRSSITALLISRDAHFYNETNMNKRFIAGSYFISLALFPYKTLTRKRAIVLFYFLVPGFFEKLSGPGFHAGVVSFPMVSTEHGGCKELIGSDVIWKHTTTRS